MLKSPANDRETEVHFPTALRAASTRHLRLCSDSPGRRRALSLPVWLSKQVDSSGKIRPTTEVSDTSQYGLDWHAEVVRVQTSTSRTVNKYFTLLFDFKEVYV
jgi:hypothetical protein